jgi:hypothetical protein
MLFLLTENSLWHLLYSQIHSCILAYIFHVFSYRWLVYCFPYDKYLFSDSLLFLWLYVCVFFMTICMCYTANLFFTLKKDLCIVGVRTSQTKSIPRRSAGDQLVYRLILTQHSPSGLFSQRAACYEGMDNPQNKNITSVRWLLIRVFASTETLDYWCAVFSNFPRLQ